MLARGHYKIIIVIAPITIAIRGQIEELFSIVF
jgi:hypothetical protein